MSFQIAIYLLLAVFIVLVELRRNKEVIFDMMTFFNLFFLLVYSIIPVILLTGGVKEYANANLYRGVFYFGKSISTPLIIFLAYLSFWEDITGHIPVRSQTLFILISGLKRMIL